MWLYAVPVFLGAFLLFQVQPLIARYVLPWFGGTPSVWTTCMLFFQVLLLLGYAYAHLVVKRLGAGGQALAHIGLLVGSAGVLALLARSWGVPIIPGAQWRPTGSEMPVLRILLVLSVSVGLPYFVLATTSPLLQSWFARTHPGRLPYRLYALSNIGSLLALLSYPFVFEPALSLHAQAWGWSWAYVLFCLVCAWVAARTWNVPALADDGAAGEHEDGTAPTARAWAQWVALPALASVMLLAVTNQVCQEVAVVPFLWVLPLSLYLLSFIICFDNERWYWRDWYVPGLVLAVPAAVLLKANEQDVDVIWQVPAYCVVLFVCCMVCHGELVALKPRPRHLTAFYLAVSAGGALGGVLVGLVAPLVFNGYHELLIGLGLCWVMATAVMWRRDDLWSRPVCILGMGPMVIAVFAAVMVWRAESTSGGIVRRTVSQSRSFYGVLRVTETVTDDRLERRFTLVHGRTIHGYQYLAPERRFRPTSYYPYDGGVGLALTHHPRRLRGVGDDAALRIAVVGLGTGTVASYGQRGDLVRFYEINPAVLELSGEDGYFTYLTDCPAQVQVALGDARVSLERELRQGSQRFDVIVLDAFSSDAIPAHLLTKEAVQLYVAHLRNDEGIIAVHISNKVLDLAPVVQGLVEELHLSAARIEVDSRDDGTLASDWVLLSPSETALASTSIDDASSELASDRHVRLWTDDYHSLFAILR